MRRIDYRSGLMFARSAVPGAIVGAFQTAWVSRGLFNIIFSLVLIAIAMAWRCTRIWSTTPGAVSLYPGGRPSGVWWRLTAPGTNGLFIR